MADWTIARLAREGGVGVETVRYYQRRGLLATPERPQGPGRAGRIRRYGEEDARRLRFIRSAQQAGFTLAQIGALLALDATDDRTRVRDLARERIAALDVQIAGLQKARAALDHLACECRNGAAGPCPILLSFEHEAGPARGRFPDDQKGALTTDRHVDNSTRRLSDMIARVIW